MAPMKLESVSCGVTQMKLESVSCGVTRLSVPGVGYADVAAQYTTGPQRWDIIVERTDIAEDEALAEMLATFRRMEGLPPVLEPSDWIDWDQGRDFPGEDVE